MKRDKQSYNIVKLIFFSILIIVIFSCSDVVDPYDYQIKSGVKGVVRDTFGNELSDVAVFCLYYSPSIPYSNYDGASLLKIADTKNFEFNLEQNLPNPFSNSTFIRFSLPDTALVKINMVNKLSKKSVYQYSEELLPGYYQHFLEKIVDKFQLLNGIYNYELTALCNNGKYYSDNKTLLIISDRGSTNSRTGKDGEYSFDYRSCSDGDSVIIRPDDSYSYKLNLTNSVYLLFEKKGYYHKVIHFELYSNIILYHDVVMTKEH